MQLNTITQLKNLRNKTVLVRVDYNVKIKDGLVLDTERIERSYETINYLIKNKAKVVLMSHLGRPGGKVKKEFSLKPVVKYLNKITKQKVEFADDCIGSKAQQAISKLKSGRILLLENLRFHKEEEAGDAKFAEELAGLGNIYVNEAFSNSHRDHASMVGITKYLPAYAGINMVKEVEVLNKVLHKPKKPAIAIIGGVKISTKIKVIENLCQKYDYLLVGGALANNFLAAQNINIGKSIFEKQFLKTAQKLLKKKNLILPLDVRIAKSLKSKSNPEVVWVRNLNLLKNKNFHIVDIGPRTELYYERLIKTSQTLIWNGPLGVFENEKMAHGTEYIAQKFAIQSKGPAFGVTGGGETLIVTEKLGIEKWIDFVSTGGGAMLEFMEGKVLPGIKPLIK